MLQVAQTTMETVSRGHEEVMHRARTRLLLPWFVTHEVTEDSYPSVVLKYELKCWLFVVGQQACPSHVLRFLVSPGNSFSCRLCTCSMMRFLCLHVFCAVAVC